MVELRGRCAVAEWERSNREATVIRTILRIACACVRRVGSRPHRGAAGGGVGVGLLRCRLVWASSRRLRRRSIQTFVCVQQSTHTPSCTTHPCLEHRTRVVYVVQETYWRRTTTTTSTFSGHRARRAAAAAGAGRAAAARATPAMIPARAMTAEAAEAPGLASASAGRACQRPPGAAGPGKSPGQELRSRTIRTTRRRTTAC